MLRAIREIQPRWVVGENVFGITNWNGGLVFDEVQTDLEAEGYEVQAYVLPACAVNAPHRRDRVWFVAYAAGNGYDAESAAKNNTNGQNNKQSRTQWECPVERPCNEQATPRADGNGQHRGNGEHEKHTSERGFDAQRNFEPGNGSGDAPHAPDIGLQQPRGAWERRAGFTDNGSVPDWGNFPQTQPTICSRDDGFSTLLDRITFSKWRNESIKAAGNAVVPQVVYEIFKAIEAYELRHKG